jgi:hypothetical protein
MTAGYTVHPAPEHQFNKFRRRDEQVCGIPDCTIPPGDNDYCEVHE